MIIKYFLSIFIMKLMEHIKHQKFFIYEYLHSNLYQLYIYINHFFL